MTIFIVSFATGMTVFTLNIHHKGVRGKEVPAVVKMICFRFLARIFCIRVESSMPEGPSVVSSLPMKANYFPSLPVFPYLSRMACACFQLFVAFVKHLQKDRQPGK